MSNKRKKNEKEYSSWTELEAGGRIYTKNINAGDKSGKTARYEKTVDKNEKTVTSIQKIFDKEGKIVEIHEKFPINKGHIIVTLLLLLVFGIATYNIF